MCSYLLIYPYFQALVVLVHDFGPNWDLVSDIINSSLQIKVIISVYFIMWSSCSCSLNIIFVCHWSFIKLKRTFYSYIHQVDGIIEVKETQMDLEVIAQLTVLTLMVVSAH
jgi:hypothetical protein